MNQSKKQKTSNKSPMQGANRCCEIWQWTKMKAFQSKSFNNFHLILLSRSLMIYVGKKHVQLWSWQISNRRCRGSVHWSHAWWCYSAWHLSNLWLQGGGWAGLRPSIVTETPELGCKCVLWDPGSFATKLQLHWPLPHAHGNATLSSISKLCILAQYLSAMLW